MSEHEESNGRHEGRLERIVGPATQLALGAEVSMAVSKALSGLNPQAPQEAAHTETTASSVGASLRVPLLLVVGTLVLLAVALLGWGGWL